MYKQIYLLTDYKGFFGSKQRSTIYRGGMNISLLVKYFSDVGYDVKVYNISHFINHIEYNTNITIIYTSSEDQNSLYKSFIEDVIFDLYKKGIKVIPDFQFLKAHNNKVSMELLRDRINNNSIKTIHSFVYGTIEELKRDINSFKYPVIIKSSAGALSRGVFKANNSKELLYFTKKISKSKNFYYNFKDYLRKLKYRSNYIPDSHHRNKFIVQNFVDNINNDWKVLVFGNKCFVLYRGNRKNDFRASGSGYFKFEKKLPPGLLDYAYNVKKLFNVPYISLDIATKNKKFFLFEFQVIFFGTTTLEKAPFYFEKTPYNNWIIRDNRDSLEKYFVDSIIRFLEN